MTIWKLVSRCAWHVVEAATIAVLIAGLAAVGTYQATRLAVDCLAVRLA